MPYDEAIEGRVRDLLDDEPDLSEKRMFGGLAFLVGGNMAVAASAEGLMVRVDPAEADELLGVGGAEPMVMSGRPMSGWIRLAPDAVRADADLEAWVERGLARAKSLPPK